jgi:hypothetical protein
VNSGTSIPEIAVGRVGMLVSLQRVSGLPEGRLAIVRQPVGWVKDLLNADYPVFAWQVFLTGEPVFIHGKETQEVIVADKCLKPVSQLAQQDLADMVELHEREVIDAAVAQVQSLVGPDEMESPEFERALTLAFSEAQLNFSKETIGVSQVLSEIGFWKVHGSSGEAFEWRTAFDGTEVKMTADPGMFGDWRLCAYAIKGRSWHMPERLALNDWPRGKLVQVVLELWESLFGNRLIPEQLQLGWMYRQHVRDMKALEPALPHIYVDGDSFRRALRWLREAYRKDDTFMGPPVNMPLAIEIKDGVLRLQSEDHIIGVKFCCGWVDKMCLSLSSLLALPPSAVRLPLVRIECTEKVYKVNGWTVEKHRLEF